MTEPDQYVYDEETYPNFFSICFIRRSDRARWRFEISERRNDGQQIWAMVMGIRNTGGEMVGFNNIGFDYPILHLLMQQNGVIDCSTLYRKAQAIITSRDDDWSHTVWESDWYCPQVDLYKIHHFDNQARRTSLKALEFARRSHSIEDLPYEPGTFLTHDQMDVTLDYNMHDVEETLGFLEEEDTQAMIAFRRELSARYERNFLNHNDTKIGKDTFIMRLEDSGIPCYERGADGRRQPRQTRRQQIRLADAVLPSIHFFSPELQRIHQWFLSQTITETKGTFKDVEATVNGFTFVFGLGGIHGSIESEAVHEDEEHSIIDLDVASYYPSLSIANRFYPEHLSETFCDIYHDVFEQRREYAKGTAINAMLKLALNGVYGDSNNRYSPFYDPLYTMKITINGQLLLCLLSEHLMTIPGLRLLQVNTDGLTVKIPRRHEGMLSAIAHWWQGETGLTLEEARYSRMFIRDVNAYIAIGTDGKIKRKGAYVHEREWHQNHSGMVIPKAAEAALVHGADVAEFIRGHQDMMDFMMLAKIPRSSKLVINSPFYVEDYPLQNVTRYYVSPTGGTLTKIMPPLKAKPDQWRRIGICVGWKVHPCNNLDDATAPIDYDYYIKEAEKLVRIFR